MNRTASQAGCHHCYGKTSSFDSAHGGPALVDVVSARQELAMPPKTTLGEALNFNLFLMKAVMDGRAAQVLDLARVNLRI